MRYRILDSSDISQAVWMNGFDVRDVPPGLDAIRRDAERVGFALSSDERTGTLLRALAASKPAGRMLELGTGVGVGTAWLLGGMDAKSQLTTVDTDAGLQEIARRHLGTDRRVTFHHGDGGAFLEAATGTFDVIFADAWPGKFTHLDLALSRLSVGGIYVIDDLQPQPTWPEGHQPKVDALISDLDSRPEFTTAKLAWATGIMLAVRTRPAAE